MITKPVVIITGVSSGIGLATARLFNEKGWVVVGTVRDRKSLPTELTTLGLDLQIAEMTNPSDLSNLVNASFKTYKRIDAVVANAGYGLVGPVESLDYKKVLAQIEVNVVAVAELVRLVVPIMRKQRRGTIVALSSISGRIPIPSYTAYSASKFALEGFFESLWYEVQKDGIRVRLIEPSTVKTPFWTKGLVHARTTRPGRMMSRFMTRSIRFGELGGLTPEDVARRVYKAAASTSTRLHYGVGYTSAAVLVRRILPDIVFRRLTAWYIDR